MSEISAPAAKAPTTHSKKEMSKRPASGKPSVSVSSCPEVTAEARKPKGQIGMKKSSDSHKGVATECCGPSAMKVPTTGPRPGEAGGSRPGEALAPKSEAGEGKPGGKRPKLVGPDAELKTAEKKPEVTAPLAPGDATLFRKRKKAKLEEDASFPTPKAAGDPSRGPQASPVLSSAADTISQKMTLARLASCTAPPSDGKTPAHPISETEPGGAVPTGVRKLILSVRHKSPAASPLQPRPADEWPTMPVEGKGVMVAKTLGLAGRERKAALGTMPADGSSRGVLSEITNASKPPLGRKRSARQRGHRSPRGAERESEARGLLSFDVFP